MDQMLKRELQLPLKESMFWADSSSRPNPEIRKGSVIVNLITVMEKSDTIERLMEYFSSWKSLKRAKVKSKSSKTIPKEMKI